MALDAGLAVRVQAGEDLWLRKPIQTNGTSQLLLDTLRQTQPLRHFVPNVRTSTARTRVSIEWVGLRWLIYGPAMYSRFQFRSNILRDCGSGSLEVSE